MGKYDINTTGEQIVADFAENVKGKTFLITGPSANGLGATLALTLASASPAHLILAGRTASKIDPVIASISALNPSIRTSFIPLDLLSTTSVRTAASSILSLLNDEPLHALINNAGVAAKKSFSLSPDGVESHFAANYLGHFLLTNLLAPKLIASSGVVVNVSSTAYVVAETNTSDPNFSNGAEYNAWVAYGRSKTANILFTYALAKKYKGGLTALVADPGMAHDSNLLANSEVDEEFLKEGIEIAKRRLGVEEMPEVQLVSMQQGIAAVARCALDGGLRGEAPAFVKEGEVKDVLPYAKDEGEALKLWGLSERLVGEEFPKEE